MAPDRDTTRFLTVDACRALVKRAAELAAGGGDTTLYVDSSWTGNLRWARNQVSTGGDVRTHNILVEREIHGAEGTALLNQIDDRHMLVALRRAERLLELKHENPEWAREHRFTEAYARPSLWSDATYNLDVDARTEGMHGLVRPVEAAGMVSAGYVQVAAHGHASMDDDQLWYYPYTTAQYSVTVRDPDGKGSGWAGVDANDWARIDVAKLSSIALDKCLRSRNPVAIEPGRYTTILEPQAVCDYVKILFTPGTLDRKGAETGPLRLSSTHQPIRGPSTSIYNAGPGVSRIGERIIDERLSVSSDPMDPECGFPPFDEWDVFHPVTWIADGVLKELAYGRPYAVQNLGINTGGLPASGAFHMHTRGPTASIDEMIATTKRGLLVTRFAGIGLPVDGASMTLTGYTRDGLWLIENGKISRPVKNLRFTDSPMFTLNCVEQIGVSTRVFRPDAGELPQGFAPVMVPALKVRDFNFTSLVDAV